MLAISKVRFRQRAVARHTNRGDGNAQRLPLQHQATWPKKWADANTAYSDRSRVPEISLFCTGKFLILTDNLQLTTLEGEKKGLKSGPCPKAAGGHGCHASGHDLGGQKHAICAALADFSHRSCVHFNHRRSELSTGSGPARSFAQSAALDQRQSVARETNFRLTGLLWM